MKLPIIRSARQPKKATAAILKWQRFFVFQLGNFSFSSCSFRANTSLLQLACLSLVEKERRYYRGQKKRNASWIRSISNWHFLLIKGGKTEQIFLTCFFDVYLYLVKNSGQYLTRLKSYESLKKRNFSGCSVSFVRTST